MHSEHFCPANNQMDKEVLMTQQLQFSPSAAPVVISATANAGLKSGQKENSEEEFTANFDFKGGEIENSEELIVPFDINDGVTENGDEKFKTIENGEEELTVITDLDGEEAEDSEEESSVTTPLDSEKTEIYEESKLNVAIEDFFNITELVRYITDKRLIPNCCYFHFRNYGTFTRIKKVKIQPLRRTLSASELRYTTDKDVTKAQTMRPLQSAPDLRYIIERKVIKTQPFRSALSAPELFSKDRVKTLAFYWPLGPARSAPCLNSTELGEEDLEGFIALAVSFYLAVIVFVALFVYFKVFRR